MESKDELIIKFRKLAYKLARPYQRGFPKSSDDIKSAALEGLCKGIEDVIRNGKYEYAGAVIYLNIRRCLLEEISKIPFIPIPASLIKKRRLECYLEQKPFKISDLYPEVYTGSDAVFSCPFEAFHNQKLKELIDYLQLDNEELAVLHLRLEEQTVREMAEELDCSKSQVHKIVERIRDKWRRKF